MQLTTWSTKDKLNAHELNRTAYYLFHCIRLILLLTLITAAMLVAVLSLVSLYTSLKNGMAGTKQVLR